MAFGRPGLRVNVLWKKRSVATGGLPPGQRHATKLDRAIKDAEVCGTGAYIEVVTDKYTAAPLVQKLHDSFATLYLA